MKSELMFIPKGFTLAQVETSYQHNKEVPYPGIRLPISKVIMLLSLYHAFPKWKG